MLRVLKYKRIGVDIDAPRDLSGLRIEDDGIPRRIPTSLYPTKAGIDINAGPQVSCNCGHRYSIDSTLCM